MYINKITYVTLEYIRFVATVKSEKPMTYKEAQDYLDTLPYQARKVRRVESFLEGEMNMNTCGVFFTMWLSRVGDCAKLYHTKTSRAANMTVRKWFATYNGLCDSLDSCAL